MSIVPSGVDTTLIGEHGANLDVVAEPLPQDTMAHTGGKYKSKSSKRKSSKRKQSRARRTLSRKVKRKTGKKQRKHKSKSRRNRRTNKRKMKGGALTHADMTTAYPSELTTEITSNNPSIGTQHIGENTGTATYTADFAVGDSALANPMSTISI